MINRFEFSLKTAHPNAAALMKEDFYWSPIEEAGPFGSDDGSDAAYGFVEWRQRFPFAGPVAYLRDLILRWGYPSFDWNELDTAKIRAYIVLPAHLDEHATEEIKEAFRNSADSTNHNLTDDQLTELMKASSRNMGLQYLLGQDNAIIGTAFAQFALEGKMDNDIKSLAIKAIKRQSLSMLLNLYDSGYRSKRKAQLEKMLGVVMNVKG